MKKNRMIITNRLLIACCPASEKINIKIKGHNRSSKSCNECWKLVFKSHKLGDQSDETKTNSSSAVNELCPENKLIKNSLM